MAEQRLRRPNGFTVLVQQSRVRVSVDFHGSSLAMRVWRQTLDTSTVLLSFLLGEKEIPIYLFCTKSPGEETSCRDTRDPEIFRESSAEQIHGPMPSVKRLFGK